MYDLKQATETIKDSHFSHDSITTEQIEKELVNYLDELIEEINNDPLYFFRENHRFWRDLDKVALAQERSEKIA